MNEMGRQPSSRLFQSIGLAIMGILVFLACWRVTDYIGIQNRSLAGAIQSSREQAAQGRPVAENYEKFLAALVEYLKVTRDQNVVMIMQQSGVPIRVQDTQAPPSAGQQTGTTQPVGKATGSKQAPSQR